MRRFSSLRIAVIALTLGLLAARETVAFADTALFAGQPASPLDQSLINNSDPTQGRPGNASPYDGPDFVVPESQIHS